ncbi:MAG: hypothetical protein PWQ25_927 [Deferribacteres bacterium]|jgi:hypothetical protein|nr:cytochrome c family protein [Deferribacteraceae bacterium]MDK2792064.1 hypothetical protein [Deferribacteres bacterium]
MKQKLMFLTVFMMVLIMVASSFAANTRDGRRKFKKYCYKECHRGNIDGVKVITPNSYTGGQWLEMFKNNRATLKRYHKNNELDKIDLSEKVYENIREYLKDHGLDSDTPETCG